MNAKDKASLLVEFFNKLLNGTLDVSYPYSSVENIDLAAKQCAIICVDEVINIIKPTDEYLSINAYYLNEKFVSDMEFNVYWQSVKAHIEGM